MSKNEIEELHICNIKSDKLYGLYIKDFWGVRDLRSKIVEEASYVVPGTYVLTSENEVRSALEELERDPNPTSLSYNRLTNGWPIYDNITKTFIVPGAFHEAIEVTGDKRIEPRLSIIINSVLNNGDIDSLLNYDKEDEAVPVEDVQKLYLEALLTYNITDMSNIHAVKEIVDRLDSLQTAIETGQHFNASALRKYYNQVMELIELRELDEHEEETGVRMTLSTYKKNLKNEEQ